MNKHAKFAFYTNNHYTIHAAKRKFIVWNNTCIIVDTSHYLIKDTEYKNIWWYDNVIKKQEIYIVT